MEMLYVIFGGMFVVFAIIIAIVHANSKVERAVRAELTKQVMPLLSKIAGKLTWPDAWKGDVDGLYYRLHATGIGDSGFNRVDPGYVMDEVRDHLKEGRVSGLVSNPYGGQQRFTLEVQDAVSLKWYTIYIPANT